jgi:hypothetical protein
MAGLRNLLGVGFSFMDSWLNYYDKINKRNVIFSFRLYSFISFLNMNLDCTLIENIIHIVLLYFWKLTNVLRLNT